MIVRRAINECARSAVVEAAFLSARPDVGAQEEFAPDRAQHDDLRAVGGARRIRAVALLELGQHQFGEEVAVVAQPAERAGRAEEALLLSGREALRLEPGDRPDYEEAKAVDAKPKKGSDKITVTKKREASRCF